MKKIFKAAHKMTREIKAEYQDVDYQAQFSICLSYLLNNEEEEEMKKERIILVADKDNKVYHVYGERNGKVFKTMENLDESKMREAYGYLYIDLGIRTIDRYFLENGVKRLHDSKTHK